ncbi:uncharacterized protein MELLADRAFT_85235 [Melampsora larici-populina 98AG31]|uniref:Uncharacterized protein n=1 Tax=Melampsora larici-populina (strain 98AG31 / pathotype 3-4-7) TaxID=747676 RepID=F4RI12_MELLP|nr:uncharacterized protein MELLADRAFT_85235 [Melampsora larici-populina 98AG31]EGG07915.1 hypothetical protein MELLADRAFT_85235 [Melampsora larici-populina 98AG31]
MQPKISRKMQTSLNDDWPKCYGHTTTQAEPIISASGSSGTDLQPLFRTLTPISYRGFQNSPSQPVSWTSRTGGLPSNSADSFLIPHLQSSRRHRSCYTQTPSGTSGLNNPRNHNSPNRPSTGTKPAGQRAFGATGLAALNARRQVQQAEHHSNPAPDPLGLDADELPNPPKRNADDASKKKRRKKRSRQSSRYKRRSKKSDSSSSSSSDSSSSSSDSSSDADEVAEKFPFTEGKNRIAGPLPTAAQQIVDGVARYKKAGWTVSVDRFNLEPGRPLGFPFSLVPALLRGHYICPTKVLWPDEYNAKKSPKPTDTFTTIRHFFTAKRDWRKVIALIGKAIVFAFPCAEDNMRDYLEHIYDMLALFAEEHGDWSKIVDYDARLRIAFATRPALSFGDFDSPVLLAVRQIATASGAAHQRATPLPQNTSYLPPNPPLHQRNPLSGAPSTRPHRDSTHASKRKATTAPTPRPLWHGNIKPKHRTDKPRRFSPFHHSKFLKTPHQIYRYAGIGMLGYAATPAETGASTTCVMSSDATHPTPGSSTTARPKACVEPVKQYVLKEVNKSLTNQEAANNAVRKFRRGLEWDWSSTAGFSNALDSSLHALPLPKPPDIKADPCAEYAIKQYPDVFKIVCPVDVPLFSHLLKDHPNRPFVDSVLHGLSYGFWPFASLPSPEVVNHPNHRICSEHPQALEKSRDKELGGHRRLLSTTFYQG